MPNSIFFYNEYSYKPFYICKLACISIWALFLKINLFIFDFVLVFVLQFARCRRARTSECSTKRPAPAVALWGTVASTVRIAGTTAMLSHLHQLPINII